MKKYPQESAVQKSWPTVAMPVRSVQKQRCTRNNPEPLCDGQATSRSARARLLAACGCATLAIALAPAGLVGPNAANAVQARTSATAASASQPDTASRVRERIDDFVHFTFVANAPIASANLRALLDTGVSPVEFVDIIDALPNPERFRDAIARAQAFRDSPELRDLASEVAKLYERGKLDRARDPAEIRRNIALLGGTQRERLIARERLRAAGEYAAPDLLQAILDLASPDIATECRQLVIEMGQEMVLPLTTALPGLVEADQAVIVRVLGDMGRPEALPVLTDVATTAAPDIRGEISRALASIERQSGARTAGLTPADLFVQLAERFYAEQPSLTNYPAEDVQLTWAFDQRTGLWPTAVATSVFHESVAMRLVERALQLNPSDEHALELWISSNFSRELDTPPGYNNPAYQNRRSADFYAAAAGSLINQRVLARALDTRDTPLARRAIAILQSTAGGGSLWAPSLDRRPLLEALAFPNRRVQYEAALAIAAAQPAEAFEGSDRVVPILAGAVRDALSRYAVVLAPDIERQNSIAGSLRASGYVVLPPAATLSRIEAELADAPGIELIVIDLPLSQSVGMIEQIRGRSDLRATPVLAMASGRDFAEIERRAASDNLTSVARTGISEGEMAAAVDTLLDSTVGGPLTAGEARDYQIRSLLALRDLAVAGNRVLDVRDAARPLLSAMTEEIGPIRMSIAEVLSYVNSATVQAALMQEALSASGSEQITLLGHVAASARRFGNGLDARQIDRLRSLARSTDERLATQAATLMGALNLPNREVLPLILGTQTR